MLTTIWGIMFIVRTSWLAVALVASSALFGITACGGGSTAGAANQEASTTSTTSTSSAAASTTSTSSAGATSASAASGASAGAGSAPAWAAPPTNVGDKISTIKVGDITVDVFQVGTAKATKSGQFVDPTTNKPVIAAGADIVFVNYVITNTGAPVDLGASLVDVTARYDDWKYLQGMDSVVDGALFKLQKVNTDALKPGAFKDPGVYTLGKGQTYSVGENFLHQKSSPITFKATATPVDAKGNLIHDKSLKGTGAGTIA